jgi:hypothetical protein
MNITINEVLRSYIDPLTANEYAALERSLLAEGCRDALVLWDDVLIDGHNRYEICRRHSIAFNTVQNTSFGSLDDVMLWMIDNHLARRSVSDFQRGVLALRKKEIVAARTVQQAGQPEDGAARSSVQLSTREDIAKAARVSSNTIGLIEKIQKAAAPELVDAVRSGAISINAAANVATLPQAEQVAAVAGGKKQLQQAAKEIREQRAAARPPKEPKEADCAEAEVVRLRAEIAALKNSNASLKTENEALSQRLAVLIDAG